MLSSFFSKDIRRITPVFIPMKISFSLGVDVRLVILPLYYLIGNFLLLLMYIFFGSLESDFSYSRRSPSDPPTRNDLLVLGK